MELRQHSIAIIDRDSMQSFITAGDPERRCQALGHALMRWVGPGALSPYVIGKPAFGGRFFGRRNILHQIISGRVIRNCTIVGNRRIGTAAPQLLTLAGEHAQFPTVLRSGGRLAFARRPLDSSWREILRCHARPSPDLRRTRRSAGYPQGPCVCHPRSRIPRGGGN